MGKFDVQAVCVRCLKSALLSPPKEFRYKNKVQGWDFMMYRTNSWICEITNSGRDYTLCPDCIQSDFLRFDRAKHLSDPLPF